MAGYQRHDQSIASRSLWRVWFGGAVTERPDLFRAAAADSPIVDLIRGYQTGSGASWAKEFGDPSNPEDFSCMLAVSAYHRLQKGLSYPAVLVSTGDKDDRVDPLQSRKLVAALQSASASRMSVMLRIDRGAGHSISVSKKDRAALLADFATFFASQLGLRIR